MITKQRMMDSGIGLDFISLSSPPLHSVPLFLVTSNNGDFYEVPHWVNVTFVDCETAKAKPGGRSSVLEGNWGKGFLPYPFPSTLDGHIKGRQTKPKQVTQLGTTDIPQQGQENSMILLSWFSSFSFGVNCCLLFFCKMLK